MYEYQGHLAYRYELVKPQKTIQMLIAERVRAVAEQSSGIAAMRSYRNATNYLHYMAAMSTEMCEFQRVPIDEFFNHETDSPRRRRGENQLHGRRWLGENQAIAHIVSQLQPGEWLNKEDLRKRARVSTRSYGGWLQKARHNGLIAYYSTYSSTGTPMFLYALPGSKYDKYAVT